MNDTIKSLAKEMGDAGYCNYIACEEILTRCWQASAREQESRVRVLEEIARWVLNTCETFDINMGVHAASTDYVRQVTTYTCFGCAATAESKWPDWKLEFRHEENCMYQKLLTGAPPAGTPQEKP